jgi:hypothetical protein
LPSASFPTDDWMRPDLASVKEESPFAIEPSYPMDGGFPDLESSNKAMDAAFDFESAASSPSPLKTENPHQPNSQNLTKSQFWSSSSASALPAQNDSATAPSVSHPSTRDMLRLALIHNSGSFARVPLLLLWAQRAVSFLGVCSCLQIVRFAMGWTVPVLTVRREFWGH